MTDNKDQKDQSNTAKAALIRLCAQVGRQGIKDAHDRAWFLGMMAGELADADANKDALEVAKAAIAEADGIDDEAKYAAGDKDNRSAVLCHIAEQQAKAGDKDAAEATFRKSWELTDGEDSDDMCNVISAQLDSGCIDLAVSCIYDCHDLDIESSEKDEMGEYVIESLINERQWSKALDLAKNLGSHLAGTIEFVLDTHSALVDAGKSQKAEAFLDKAVESFDEVVSKETAAILFDLGLKEKAKAVLKETHKAGAELGTGGGGWIKLAGAEPKNANSVSQGKLAMEMARQGMRKEAREIFAELVSFAQNRPQTLRRVADMQARAGFVEDALSTVQGLEAEVDSVKKLDSMEIAEGLMKSGGVIDAVCFARKIDKPRARARVWHKMALAQIEYGRIDSARAMLAEARDALGNATGDNMSIYYDIINAYSKFGDVDEVLSTAKGIDDRPNLANIYGFEAVVIANDGDVGWAKETFAMALDAAAGIEDECNRALALYQVALRQAEAGFQGKSWDDEECSFATIRRIAGVEQAVIDSVDDDDSKVLLDGTIEPTPLTETPDPRRVRGKKYADLGYEDIDWDDPEELQDIYQDLAEEVNRPIIDKRTAPTRRIHPFMRRVEDRIKQLSSGLGDGEDGRDD